MISPHILKGLCVLAFLWAVTPLVYGENTFTQTCRETLSTTWQEGRLELLVPVRTWHNRTRFSHEQIARYNEDPWGIGLAKTYVDDRSHRHRLFALTFQDSHDKPEPTMGYSWQVQWRADSTVRPTLGLLAGITFRDDYHWIPIPAVLPVAGLDIGPFSVESTYIIIGEVLFTWVTWRF